MTGPTEPRAAYVFIRWLHNAWRLLLAAAAAIFVTGLSVALLLFLLLQLPQGKNWLGEQMTDRFNEQYEGTIRFESIDGTLPFHTVVTGLRIDPPGETERPVLSADSVELRIGLWSLLQRNIHIHSLKLNRPVVRLEENEEGILSLAAAFRQSDPELERRHRLRPGRFDLIAPNLSMSDGMLVAATTREDGSDDEFTIRRIDGTLYMELTDQQRFLDIEQFSAHFDDDRFGSVEMQGQIFSDTRFIEMNAFRIRIDDSRLNFSAEASPVDLFEPDLAAQLAEATYRIDLQESRIGGRQLASFLPDWPFSDTVLDIELQAEGTPETLYIDRLIARINNSSVHLTGQMESIGTPEFRYSATLANVVLESGEMQQLLGDPDRLDRQQVDYLAESRLEGQIGGDLRSFESTLSLLTERGAADLRAEFHFEVPHRYEASLLLDSLDLSPLFPQHLQRNLLNGTVRLTGSGFDPDIAAGEISADLESGVVNRIEFGSGRLRASWEDRSVNHLLSLESERGTLRSSGRITNRDDRWVLDLEGNVQRFEPLSLFPELPIPLHSITAEYATELNWSSPDDLFGRLTLQIDETVMGEDTLRAHQLYADLDPPASEPGQRRLRLTSSIADADLYGDLRPLNLLRLRDHWRSYFEERVAEEIVFAHSNEERPAQELPLRERLQIDLDLKEVDLLHAWLEKVPEFRSRSRVRLNLDAGSERMLLTGTANDSGFEFGDFRAGEIVASLTAGFNYESTFRDNATFDLRLSGRDYSWKSIDVEEGFLSASMRNDTLMVRHQATADGGERRLDLTLLGKLFPDAIETEIRDLLLAGRDFEWRNSGRPLLRFTEGGRVEVDQMILASEGQEVELHGIFSNDPDEYVSYRIRSLDLAALSDLIDGRVSFGGELNAEFNSRTLTLIPAIDGNLEVRRGMLENRLVGDVRINGRYSGEREQFDTQITVFTDPERYPTYFARNDSIGQNLQLDGYVKIPDFSNPGEEFFYFDADLREIDTWIATVIAPRIIQEAEGRSTGKGFVSGSLENINFHAEFDIRDVEAVPVFLNTRYRLNGRLLFDRYEGLYFDNMDLRDDRGGRGNLTGSVDLDNFSDTNYLDLTLDLENLHFMNNPFDPDVPFYSNSRGTGQARITGSNFSPYLRTTRPIVITGGSRISVPLRDEAELQQSHSFIQFVDTFDPLLLLERELRQIEEGERVAADPADLTFVERFTLDLQFLTEEPVQFQLVFDRVTNEVLTANGTGQIRLTLEDQSFNLFGRMNISGGDYQFVAGDIISRRFQLIEGGSIIWEGDPANARLNVQAYYRARPDLSSLLTTGSPGRLDGAQRVPIDLVLHIGGTLAELENDFYFQIPSTIEGTLDPTMLAQINALNRNEEEKVIQATSLLLSGNFIPLATASTDGGTGSALRETLTGGTVVNPIITGQVINPLLSDQINSLLRSDMAVDIDFNLTPYNQVDLGVALRLYDDRLILRRDGQITGPYSDIGDLGATYRINRTFALTAFHRQDPTLSGTSGTEPRQVQEMNGVGVEARVQFNTWQEFRHRIGRALGRLFGRKESGDSEPAASDYEENNKNEDGEEILASDR